MILHILVSSSHIMLTPFVYFCSSSLYRVRTASPTFRKSVMSAQDYTGPVLSVPMLRGVKKLPILCQIVRFL